MTLRKHGKENHQAEETLTKFANIHIQNDTKYKEATQRILLQQNVTILFSANVSYHKIVINHFIVHVMIIPRMEREPEPRNFGHLHQNYYLTG